MGRGTTSADHGVRSWTEPIRIVVALDVSGSIEDKIDEVSDALRHLIDLVEPQEEILLMTFSDQPRVIEDFTSERGHLGRSLDALRAAGGTALHDAVIDAATRVGAADEKRARLLPFGDERLVVLSETREVVSSELSKTFDELMR